MNFYFILSFLSYCDTELLASLLCVSLCVPDELLHDFSKFQVLNKEKKKSFLKDFFLPSVCQGTISGIY